MDAIRRFEGTMVNGGLGALDHIVVTGGYLFWGCHAPNVFRCIQFICRSVRRLG